MVYILFGVPMEDALSSMDGLFLMLSNTINSMDLLRSFVLSVGFYLSFVVECLHENALIVLMI